jgi:regulator of protease activity HflC (stomatin/prohibitin superfamily)
MTSFLYRPAENHIGIVYRSDRFNRLATPDRWTFLLPFEEVTKEVSMDMRTAIVSLRDVLTRDQVLTDLDLKVFFSVDVRQTDPTRLLQVVRFVNDEAFEQIIKTNTNDVVRNMVFASRDFAELNSVHGRAWLKENLSREIGQRVRNFGILVGEFGVNIAGFQPNASYLEALKERSAAYTQGLAELERNRPALTAAQELTREPAIISVLMSLASTITKTGQIPEIVFPDSTAPTSLTDNATRRTPNRPRTNPIHPGGYATD